MKNNGKVWNEEVPGGILSKESHRLSGMAQESREVPPNAFINTKLIVIKT